MGQFVHAQRSALIRWRTGQTEQGVFRHLQAPWLQAKGRAQRVAIRGVIALAKASWAEQQSRANTFEYRRQFAAALTGRHRYPEQSRLLASQAHQVPLRAIG